MIWIRNNSCFKPLTSSPRWQYHMRGLPSIPPLKRSYDVCDARILSEMTTEASWCNAGIARLWHVMTVGTSLVLYL